MMERADLRVAKRAAMQDMEDSGVDLDVFDV